MQLLVTFFLSKALLHCSPRSSPLQQIHTLSLSYLLLCISLQHSRFQLSSADMYPPPPTVFFSVLLPTFQHVPYIFCVLLFTIQFQPSSCLFLLRIPTIRFYYVFNWFPILLKHNCTVYQHLLLQYTYCVVFLTRQLSYFKRLFLPSEKYHPLQLLLSAFCVLPSLLPSTSTCLTFKQQFFTSKFRPLGLYLLCSFYFALLAFCLPCVSFYFLPLNFTFVLYSFFLFFLPILLQIKL